MQGFLTRQLDDINNHDTIGLEDRDPGCRVDEIIDFIDGGLRTHGVGLGIHHIECLIRDDDQSNRIAIAQRTRHASYQV